ncbi:MAG: undecaprenyl-diphosphate phosphatase [Opitutales bacterium]|nr:undecaprenyl-diphosphate phosphatase [Opitutales bacterium]MCH8539942.1 hypothetical protein [Opitutales bacterium]
MSFWDAIIMGLVQGLSEFLPISSTAHIMIAARLLALETPGLALEIWLHMASVLAVMLYFRKDLWKVIGDFTRFLLHRRPEDRVGFWFGVYILIATAITGGLGVLLSDSLGENLRSPLVIGIALWVTAAFLIFIERGVTYGQRTEEKMTWRDAVLVGLGQTVAVLPGISRSGATLVTALWCGLERETAVRYSFLLAIPVILGSSVLGIRDADMEWIRSMSYTGLLLSFVVCFFASWVSIVWLIGFLRSGRLYWFAIYCFLLGGLSLFFL